MDPRFTWFRGTIWELKMVSKDWLLGVHFYLCLFGFLLIWGTLWDFFLINTIRKTEFRDDSRRAWKTCPKNVWFVSGWNPEKWTPVQAGAWFWGFCPTPEKNSMLEVFWYLLLELLGSSSREKMVFRCAWIFFTFYTDFYAILDPENNTRIM